MVPLSSSARPQLLLLLLRPQLSCHNRSKGSSEVTRCLQTVATPVPGVDKVPPSSPSRSAASVTESPIVCISEHVATPPTAVVQHAVYNALGSAHAAIQVRRFWHLILAMFNQHRNILLVYL